MAYAKRLTQEAEWAIKPITSKFDSLAPGQTVILTVESASQLDKVRSWLYTYLRIHNLKSRFKIRQDTPTQLSLVCQDIPVVKATLLAGEYTFIESYVRDNLLECSTLEEVGAIVRQDLENGNLTDEEFVAIMEEWEKKVGGAEKAKPTTKVNLDDPFVLVNPNI